MAPRRWTTSQELEWLQNELPEFLKMQKEQKLTRFYELLSPKWFSRFPERFKYWEPTGNPPHGRDEVDHQNDDSIPDGDESVLLPLTPEQEAELEGANEIRRKKLKEWFRNNAKSKTTPSSTSTSKAFAQLLGQRARSVRDLKDIEVYSRTYYKMKVQPLVEDDIQENQLDAKNRIAIVQKHIHNCFEAEPEEVKAEIREEAAKINASRRLGSIVSDTRTKEEIYRAIQELPMVLGQICDDLAKLTGGWHFSVVMGGADPMCPGDIMTLSYHHSKNQDGHSFKAANPDFHEQYLMPFEKHLQRVFTTSSSSLPIPSPSPPQAHTHHDPEEPSLPVPVESPMMIPDPSPPAPPDFASPNTQNDTHTPVPVESLMDPNFPVCDTDIDAFLATICPLASDGPHGDSLPRVSATPLPSLFTTNSHSVLPISSTPVENVTPSPGLEHSTAVDNDSHSLLLVSSAPAPLTDLRSLLPISSAPAPLTDTTSIPTTTNTLIPAGSVPSVSTAPGRRSLLRQRSFAQCDGYLVYLGIERTITWFNQLEMFLKKRVETLNENVQLKITYAKPKSDCDQAQANNSAAKCAMVTAQQVIYQRTPADSGVNRHVKGWGFIRKHDNVVTINWIFEGSGTTDEGCIPIPRSDGIASETGRAKVREKNGCEGAVEAGVMENRFEENDAPSGLLSARRHCKSRRQQFDMRVETEVVTVEVEVDNGSEWFSKAEPERDRWGRPRTENHFAVRFWLV
ncbi:uncharacterized protein F5147DRAFT_656516 [Suillus discolor]|uniref:Uncharacterized protein n=1 Tax=Suillus discolor TaxID=1912936 RepID=A0A9P7JPU8_9AGAM|nr:uncharacterized protein F5147DRAFT_656516 [Suillus discolor]KAG2096704.1 hypothetical protein F5147DRAFT_656516 [Suillus discolor]